MTGASAITLLDLRFSWETGSSLLAIDRFTMERGERVFLSGPSGSGKSTLLGLICGLLVPQRGSVQILGTDIARMKPHRRDQFRGAHLGYIFQMFNLIPYLSVLANVLLPLQFSQSRRSRLGDRDPDEEAVRLLSAMGLEDRDLLERSVLTLSAGQQQRVAAARALIGRPALIVADEPTSSLDAAARDGFIRLLMEECAASGTTLLFVSHDSALQSLFDRTVAMNDINNSSLH